KVGQRLRRLAEWHGCPLASDRKARLGGGEERVGANRFFVRAGADARTQRATRRRPRGVRPNGNAGTLSGRIVSPLHPFSRRTGEGDERMNESADRVPANGPTTLSDRVKELRLTGKLAGTSVT